jgi:predicted MFS family arabinose efflux permease
MAIAAGCAILFVDNTPRGIYAGTAALAAGIALMYPALAALTIARQPNPTQRALLIGSFSLFFELGSGFGGAIIGPTADHFGRRGGFAVGAIVPLLALVTIRTLIIPGIRKATENR